MIISPTRELSIQIHKVITGIGEFMNNLSCNLLIGGQSMEEDIKILEKRPHVIVGTPGRIHDLIRRKK